MSYFLEYDYEGYEDWQGEMIEEYYEGILQCPSETGGAEDIDIITDTVSL